MALFGRETEQDQARVAAYTSWFQRQDPLALVACVLSVFSLTHFGTLWVDGIAGIVLGAVALRRVRQRNDGIGGGEWLAWGAIAIGVVSLILAIVIYFVIPAPPPPAVSAPAQSS